MTIRGKFITWQPVLTDHQAFTFQALAQKAGVPVVAYVTTMEDSARKAQGWTDTKVSSLDRILIPNHGFLRYCYRQLREYRTDVHLFGSPFQQPRLMFCLFLAIWLRIEFYLISEPYSPGSDSYLSNTASLLDRLRAALRPWMYKAYVLLLRRHVAGVFAISQLALAQYQQGGMPLSKLFPFGYFIPSMALVETPSLIETATAQGLRIVFVGNLIRRKGVDLLLEAIHQLEEIGYTVSVDIYGPGDESALTRSKSTVRYCGTIPFGEAQSVISRYDLLVLPSRYDGWGVVVNEALCAGVPVVCSDTTGAGNVAKTFGAGLCFASGDARSLSDVLVRILHDPSLLPAMRVAAASTALILQPEIAAHYMLDVIQAPAGRKATLYSPWYPDRA